MISHNFLHIFLVWNLFLALIPLLVVFLLDKKVIKSKIGIVISLLVWLFFFPNSFYIITDLIYVDTNDFVFQSGPYNPTVYLQNIPAYLGLFHIYLGAFIGLIYGYKSINVLYDYSKDYSILKKYRNILVIFVFGLSSFAIYIGRFFRYNSWDIFKIYQIIKDFFEDLSWFTVFFIGFMTIIQIVVFYLIRTNSKEMNKVE
jgi:uncharacterized membrane protein